MEVERRKKILGYVTRGEKSEYGVGEGVALEVWSAWVKYLVKSVKMEVERRETFLGYVKGGGAFEYGLDLGVTLEGGSAWGKPYVKDEAERREKILGLVARGEEFENAGVEPRRPPERAQKSFEKVVFWRRYVRIYVRGCRREDW